MIKKILIGFLIVTLVILVLLWFVTGGVGKTIGKAGDMNNPIKTFFFGGAEGGFKLPWQPENLYPEIYEIPDDSSSEESSLEGESAEEELARTEKEYERVRREAESAQTFGEPSPMRGSVHIGEGAAAEGSSEYIEIEADWGNTAPVNVSGWSLQSALTGIRAYIPRGTQVFVLGALNEQNNIYLNPGMTAIVSSADSPVGTSFRENICVGYLGRMQAFSPALSAQCPSPAQSLTLTADNLRAYGDACYDFVQSLPSCALVRSAPPEVSAECRTFLSNTISYNGCVDQYRYRGDFSRPSWRIYLSAGGELWRNTHDVIRLLDGEGRTVDVLSY